MINDQVLRLPEVIRITGLSKSTINRKAADGTFPKPVKLGTRASGWKESEITNWFKGLKHSGRSV